MKNSNKDNLKKIFSLKDKVIVITGACGLLGRMHVEAVASQGGIPIIIDLNQEKLDNLYQHIYEEYSIECFKELVDITNEKQVSKSAERIIKKFTKIDGLVNNAAINPSIDGDDKINFKRIEDFNMESWDKELSVGISGSFICIKHYGSKIALNNNGGSIVNISSDLGIIAPDQRIYAQEGLDPESQPVKPITYSVIKSAMLGLSRYVSTYWANKNVRCNCLLPGGVQTNQDDVFVSKLVNLIPLGRMATKNEYQGALIFLLSDASSYMTGSNLIVDGGRTAW
tara:strand:+ start:14759 stop:15607 length:849 start_codon:yes stop_codon:yes gene_type:complete